MDEEDLSAASGEEQQDGTAGANAADPAGQADHGAVDVYPSNEHNMLVEAMNHFHVSNVNLAESLVKSLGAAAKIIQQGDRMRQTDLDAMRRFFREALGGLIDKVFNEERIMTSVEEGLLLNIAVRLCCVAASMLQFRAQQQPAQPGQLFEVDQDLAHLVMCLRMVFDTNLLMHEWYGEQPLPPGVEQVESAYATALQRAWPNEDEYESDDIPEGDELHAWVAHLINWFGLVHGFDAVQQLLSHPENVHLPLLAELMHMVRTAAVVGDGFKVREVLMVDAALQDLQEATLPLMAHLLELAGGGDEERLTDKGQDRTYMHLSRMLQQVYLLHRLPSTTTHAQIVEAHKLVSSVQQRFVLHMLESTSFNKLLSGARECFYMLNRAAEVDHEADADDEGGQFEAVVKWMDEHQMIERMLRMNLHQRQYVNQICWMLVLMTQHGFLREEHLNLLWAKTEQEDQYEAVKDHVYFMLSEMTKHFSQDQLDMLFRKFELNRARSLLDMRKLLELLRNLAASDNTGKMAQNIMSMVINLTMKADSAPELAQPNVLLDIAAAYQKAGCDHTSTLLNMALQNLRAPVNQVPYLKLLNGLVKHQPNGKVRDAFVDHILNEKLGMPELLVRNLVRLVGAARQLRRQNPGAELPGEGCWSYGQLVHEYVVLLRLLAVHSANFLDQGLALKLWQCLVADPVTSQEQQDGVAFFKTGISGAQHASPFIEHATMKQLLVHHMTRMDAASMSSQLFAPFIESFRQVNATEERLPNIEEQFLPALTLNGLIGLDYLWLLHNCNNWEWVERQSRLWLAKLYHTADRAAEAAPFKAAFVQRVVGYLQSHIKSLELGADVDKAVRTIKRVLITTKECTDEVEGLAPVHTMPPVPAHSCSWRGTPVLVELTGSTGSSSNGRWRIPSHSNEYMGSLRAKVAQHLNCSPKQVRLFYTGQEYKTDSHTVAQCGIRSSRHIIMAQVSPQDNSYTRLPAEYRQEWEQQSLTWMLSNQSELYDMLFKLSDSTATSELRSIAWNLLQMLPTCPPLPGELEALLLGPQPMEQLRAQLMGGKDGPAAALRPYHMLYSLQALCALLFPASQEAAAAPDVDEQMGDADAAAAGAGEASTGAAGAITAGQRAALQEAFLSSGCLVVVFQAVEAAVAASRDLDFLRALGHLLVVLLHNVLAATRQPPAVEAASTCEGSATPAAAAPVAPDSRMEEADGSCSEQAGSDIAQAGSTAPTPPPDSDMEGNSTGPVALTAAAAQADADVAVAASPSPRNPRKQAAGQQQQALPRPVSVSPLPQTAAALDLGTLRLVQRMLLRLALDTSMLWHVPGALRMRDDDANTDVLVVKEALSLLHALLLRAPELLGQLLGSSAGSAAESSDSSAAQLVSRLLLNQHYGAVRRLAADLLSALCMDAPHAHLWLFQQLLATRPAASAAPAVSCEYYELFTKVVNSMASVDVAQQEYGLAEQLLMDEVRSLQQQQQQQEEQGAAPDVQLTGRLQLLLALVQVLDRRSVGGGSEGGLIRLLLQQYLFPEALLRCDERCGRLDLAAAGTALEARCSSGPGRKAALDLVAELMRGSPASLEEGVSLLVALHYGHHDVPEGLEISAPSAVRAPGCYCGLKNPAATCYMNSVFQQLFMQPRIRELVLGAGEVPPAERPDSVFGQLQSVFAHMALSKHSYHTPHGFWAAFKDYDGTPVDVREHQDAYEFFTRLQDTVDQHLISTGQTPAIGAVMGGRFAQQVICRGHDFRSEREEEFYQISVDVRGMGSLQKSLETYVQGELMEGDNAYFCEELGKRVPAVKRACIKALPHTLAIHLKRFEFDYHSQTRFKVRERFEFPAEINMFRYTADGLAAEEAAAGAAAATANGDGRACNGGASLQASQSDAAAQLGAAQQPGYMYDLKGVVVHSGSAFTGHYYAYIKERRSLAADGSTTEGDWYCFDDKSVRPWDVRGLEADCFGGRASQDSDSRVRPSKGECDRPYSAYMLFYERREGAALDVAAGAAAMPTAQVVGAAAGSSQQQQCGRQQGDEASSSGAAALQRARGGPASSSGAVPFRPPYGMPLSLYHDVVTSNMAFMHRLHVFDKDYFRFVRQVVEAKCDVECATRKSRRLPAASNSQGSSQGPKISHMSCDPAAGAAGAAGPSPVCAGDGGGAHAMELASPGPSSRRGQDQERVAVALTRLATLFLFQVHMQAHASLRTDANIWKEALMNLLAPAANPCSMACLTEFIRLLQEHPKWLMPYLVDHDVHEVRSFAGELLSWALPLVANRSNLPQVLGQGQEPSQLTAGLMQVVRQLAAVLQQCTGSQHVGSIMELAYVLYSIAKVGSSYAAFLCSQTNVLQSVVETTMQHVVAGQAPPAVDVVDDLRVLYRLAWELLRGATNMPKLAAELNPAGLRRPSSSGSGSGASSGSGSRRSSSDGSPAATPAAAATAAAAAADPAAVCWTVSAPAYKLMVVPQFVMGLATHELLQEEECVQLALLLTRDNTFVSYMMVALLQNALTWHLRDLYRVMTPIVRIISQNDSLQLVRTRQFLCLPDSSAAGNMPQQNYGLVWWMVLTESQSNNQTAVHRRLITSQLLGMLLLAVPAVQEAAATIVNNGSVKPVWGVLVQRLLEHSSLLGNDPATLAALHAVVTLVPLQQAQQPQQQQQQQQG